jgi:hypothetical protein
MLRPRLPTRARRGFDMTGGDSITEIKVAT